MEDKRQAEALFRYSLMREFADPGLGPPRRGVMTRALAELEHARAVKACRERRLQVRPRIPSRTRLDRGLRYSVLSRSRSASV